jgi:hypothetical protein
MEELDVFCGYLTRVASEALGDGPLQALVQADDDERILLTVVLPEEFALTVEIPREEALRALAEVLRVVQDFALNHYRENLLSEESWEAFTALPGQFEFLCDDAPELCYRLARWRVTERFGKRFFKGIDLYEDALQIHMLGGNYMVGFRHFREELERQMDYMGTLLRKPLRKRYDKKP